MKNAVFLGVAGAFFFAFTFILNKSMHLSGGNWIWSASLRYMFTLPILGLIVGMRCGLGNIHAAIGKNQMGWFLWSTVGFGLFYAPMTFAAAHGDAWLVAASWQITITAGILLSPVSGIRISMRSLLASGVILAGVFMLQAQGGTTTSDAAMTLIPVLIGAFAYPWATER